MNARDRRVRVLWLVKGLGPGGAEQLLVNQAGATDHERFEVEAAYLLGWKHHLVPALAERGVGVYLLDGGREVDLRWAWRLRSLLRARPFDVLHVHSPYVAAVTRLVLPTLPASTRPRLVTTEHNRWPRHSAMTRRANRATFRLDDHHLAVSEDVVHTIPPALARRVEVLVHGVDVAAVRARRAGRAAVRAELGFTDADVVVGIVANFRREKAYDDWLAAAVDAARRDPHLHFVSVGQGPLEDELRAALAAALAEHDLAPDRVRILGYQPDAVRTMAAFDAFTLTSLHEGLPVSLMEALVLGLPVVATAVGGIPQAVRDGVEAVLVPPRRPDLLAEAYLALAGDTTRRAEMAEAARIAGERFDIAVATRRLEACYLALAQGRRPPPP